MKRTRKLNVNKPIKDTRQIPINVLSELVNRASLASTLGYQYGGDRNIYQALGYPTTTEIKWNDYYNRYARQDIAKAIIDRPVKASWKGEISIIENIDKEKTKFEQQWEEIYDRLKLKSIFMRADKLTGIGQFSVLLLGLSDVRNIAGFKKKYTKSSNSKLLYVKPVSQKSVDIIEFERNVNSPRYGFPLMYKISTSEVLETGQIGAIELVVHHSRIIHLVEDILESEIYGTPRLQAVYNRLMDLEKLIGGDAEMFWRGARPGFTGKVDENYEMTATALTDLQDQIDEFEHNLRRVLVNEGVNYQALTQEIADPLNHVNIQIQMISAVTAIPKRILTGSERGELSSAQDKQEWISYVTSRREEQNEPYILRPFIDKLIKIGILAKPKDGKYIVMWDKLFSLSDSEKVAMGEQRAKALKLYTDNMFIQDFVSFEIFLEYFLALDKPQIDKVLDQQKKTIRQEVPLTEEEIELTKLPVPSTNGDKK